MAGIVVPTIFMVVIVTVFAAWRSTIMPLAPDSPSAPTVGDVLLLEALGRAIIFPMAIVPNVWGLWNVLYLAAGGKMPSHSASMARFCLSSSSRSASAWQTPSASIDSNPWILPFAATAMVAYYLVWKHIVGFLNAEMGIA
jgi:hypothetical protein